MSVHRPRILSFDPARRFSAKSCRVMRCHWGGRTVKSMLDRALRRFLRMRRIAAGERSVVRCSGPRTGGPADGRACGRVGRHTLPCASHTEIHKVASWLECVLLPAVLTLHAAMAKTRRRPSAHPAGPSPAPANPYGPSPAPANPDELEEGLNVYVYYALNLTLCIGLARIMQWVHVLGRWCCRRKQGRLQEPPGRSAETSREGAPGVRVRAAGKAAYETRTR